MKFIKLSNGAIFAIEKITLVARKDIGQFMIFLDGLTGGSVNADVNDFEAIQAALGEDLIIVPSAPPVEIKSRLEIPAD